MGETRSGARNTSSNKEEEEQAAAVQAEEWSLVLLGAFSACGRRAESGNDDGDASEESFRRKGARDYEEKEDCDTGLSCS